MLLNCGVGECSFLKIIFYFNWRLFTLQYCSGFCHTLKWISLGCTRVHHPGLLSYLPPHPILQGYPSAPTLSALFQALNLDWRSVSHMVIYMFQCYSLNHHTLIKKSVLYIYVSFAILHIGSSFSSVQFSHSVVSDSLRPHESQHARPPCPCGCDWLYINPY